MGPKEIQALRHALGENSETFGKRFSRSKRTVEDWEQGRRRPDALVLTMMGKLADGIDKKRKSAASRNVATTG